MTIWPDDGTSTLRTAAALETALINYANVVSAAAVRVVTNPDTNPAIKVTQLGTTSASTSTGGAVNLDNTLNTGAGLVIYSNQANPAGRLFVVRADSATFNQAAVHIQSAGTGPALEVAASGTGAGGTFAQTNTTPGSASSHALTANQSATSGANASALNVTSSNPAASCIQVTGSETGRGTIKVTHTGPGSNADANASALSIDLQGVNTACQGIHIDSVAQGTTGALLDIRNNGNQLLKVLSDATFAIPSIVLGSGGPTITIGTGIPSVSLPNGSLFLRTDGTGPNLYVRENGAWVSK